MELGPTGEFPKGKISESDEGGMQIAIGHSEGNVIIDFGVATAWVGIAPDQALEIARSIQQHAYEARGGRTQ